MPILVSDTSVLIDLERAQLIEDMFRLPFEFAVPDLLYARELAGELGELLVGLGLRIEVRPDENVLSCADQKIFKRGGRKGGGMPRVIAPV